MATLANKTVLVVGGSSGIGFGVAKASLLSGASKVVIASSSQAKVEAALERLRNQTNAVGGVEGAIVGEVVDGKDSKSVRALLGRIGEIDHLVWSSGDTLQLGVPNVDLDENKGIFDVRFWGAISAAQAAKIRPGGSITFTIGQSFLKPQKGWSQASAVLGAIDAVARGLAVDLAPIRVNVVSPGYVKTEMWDAYPSELGRTVEETLAAKLLVGHAGDADEIAEAYLFCMKCTYLTGQRIEVDGGAKYV